MDKEQIPGKETGITTANHLLYLNGELIGLPAADHLANKYGYVYAERLVKAMEAANAGEVRK